MPVNEWRDIQRVSPPNNTRCVVVKFSDSSCSIAWQRFGKWQNVLSGADYARSDIIAWRHLTPDDLGVIDKALAEDTSVPVYTGIGDGEWLDDETA